MSSKNITQNNRVRKSRSGRDGTSRSTITKTSGGNNRKWRKGSGNGPEVLIPGKLRRETDEIYDIFGARVQKPCKQQKRSYRPEYCKIDLPQQPNDLVCGICGNTISGKFDVLEALEIRSGEFSVEVSDTSESIPAHFRCVLQAVIERVQLEKGESVAYLGAGKFAVVQETQRVVKYMIERSEWSQNSSLSPTNRAAWRQSMVSHFLVGALSIETDV